MEFCHFFLFVTFVVLTVDQFVERALSNSGLKRKQTFYHMGKSSLINNKIKH